MATLVHELLAEAAARTPEATALRYQGRSTAYGLLWQQVSAAAQGLLALGLGRGERVAVYLEKREETVIALFAAAAAGCVFVPVNPLLKSAQVQHILRDCHARVLITSAERYERLPELRRHCPDLQALVLTGAAPAEGIAWADFLLGGAAMQAHPCIETDMAALLYTSGSTGLPKGVILSHHNLVCGARSVATYLGNTAEDRLLAVLPLSFDYGLSQLTTAFSVGATVVLLNHLLSRDVIETVHEERVTGLAAVPPLWIQLSLLAWPASCSLRYLTNSGGALPQATVGALRAALPSADLYLMYGLTEAFRSTYLAPAALSERPGSIGKAIPNAEILVLRPDGSPCEPGEQGELVHRGPLVAQGYWNDPERTAQRFRPLPQSSGQVLPELAVWSGDTVYRDAQGYLYFVGRNDDMIKTSGYRVSPLEVEEVCYATGKVAEVAAVGLPHPVLGQAIAVLASARDGCVLDGASLLAACRTALPAYMVPAWIDIVDKPLPRNPNGKIDRRALAYQLAHLFDEVGA